MTQLSAQPRTIDSLFGTTKIRYSVCRGCRRCRRGGTGRYKTKGFVFLFFDDSAGQKRDIFFFTMGRDGTCVIFFFHRHETGRRWYRRVRKFRTADVRILRTESVIETLAALLFRFSLPLLPERSLRRAPTAINPQSSMPFTTTGRPAASRSSYLLERRWRTNLTGDASLCPSLGTLPTFRIPSTSR